MSDDDPVHRRAKEIKAEGVAAERASTERERHLREERLRLVGRFSQALANKTEHVVQCVEGEGPHAAVVRFSFIKDGKPWTQEILEFGIDRIDEDPDARRFSYYLELGGAAFAVPDPKTGVARSLKNATLDEVIDYAIVIAIEMMARTVATGGLLGSPAEIDAQLDRHERSEKRRERQARAARRKRFWSGCAKAIVWFFGIVIGIGLLGNIMRACSGS